ncbi:MAG: type III pantothenate kinase [Tepidisphaeraceae bacterium]|jgi:type III pantothenate kinase
MEINLIVLNAGNSRLAIGTFVAGEMQHVVRVSNDDRAQWAAEIAKAWEIIKDREEPAVTAASVNPPMAAAVDQAVRAAIGQEVEWVGRDIDLPIKVLTDHPAETGVDRVLNIAAAYEQLEHACIVVDAGTAITIDLCNNKGEFLGGAIAPGAGTMLRAMHRETAQLPLVELDVPAAPYGKNTREAILHGVYHGIRGMVKEIVENYATDLGAWPEVIATGGDAEKLFGGWEIVHAVSPDLTLYGIALAYTEHHIHHDEV